MSDWLNSGLIGWQPFAAIMIFWTLLKILHRLDQILAALQKP
jgi:hypothetical protein